MILSLFFNIFFMGIKGFESKNDNWELDEKNKKESKEALVNFWKDSENDKKFLENPQSGKNAISAIKWDIEAKTKSIKNPDNKAKIEEKLKWLETYAKPGKLALSEAQELSNVYKEISAIQWTEVKEDNIQWENAQKAMENNEHDYEKKLDDAIARIEKILTTHSEEAQNKLQQSLKNSQEARNIPQENPPSLDDFPSAQKESPTDQV